MRDTKLSTSHLDLLCPGRCISWKLSNTCSKPHLAMPSNKDAWPHGFQSPTNNVSPWSLSSKTNAPKGMQCPSSSGSWKPSANIFRWRDSHDLPGSFYPNLPCELHQHVAQPSLHKRHHGPWDLDSHFSLPQNELCTSYKPLRQV